MGNESESSRRSFLKTGAAVGALAGFLRPARVLGAKDRVRSRFAEFVAEAWIT